MYFKVKLLCWRYKKLHYLYLSLLNVLLFHLYYIIYKYSFLIYF